MIEFIEINDSEPYELFINKYNKAFLNKEKNIEAVAVSSYNKDKQEVDSRFVNLKYIKDTEWIFFSNYESQKAKDFQTHNQVSAVFFWRSTNTQIRMKAKIKKTTNDYNQKYFFDRSEEKNALAISSNQSRSIDSYSEVKENYKKSLESDDLKKCPEFWGGYSFIPYYFEFWEGHESRLNKRVAYEKKDDSWKHLVLQP